ncbi:MAG: VOC family protein [Nostoc sp.]|uniref:VOC family protein n=1 Tax=Nostoc sp. TaxID=1180 RepID=UPI002FF5D44A
MTATITRPKPKKAATSKPQSPYKRLHVIIPDDVDAAFNRAVEASAVILVVPKQKPWGQKVGYVRDLDGILIKIASLI